MELDMKDKYDKSYSKGNCTWITMQEQFQNRSTTKIKKYQLSHLFIPLLSVDGKTRAIALAQLAEQYNVSKGTIRKHYNDTKEQQCQQQK